MSIRTKQYCDICELKLGEEHPDALIVKPQGKPAFPQLIWTYYKKGKQLFTDPHTKEPTIKSEWLGKPKRFEFCEEHGADFNTLFKALGTGDSEFVKILDKLRAEDQQKWDEKEKKTEAEFCDQQLAWAKATKKKGKK